MASPNLDYPIANPVVNSEQQVRNMVIRRNFEHSRPAVMQDIRNLEQSVEKLQANKKNVESRINIIKEYHDMSEADVLAHKTERLRERTEGEKQRHTKEARCIKEGKHLDLNLANHGRFVCQTSPDLLLNDEDFKQAIQSCPTGRMFNPLSHKCVSIKSYHKTVRALKGDTTLSGKALKVPTKVRTGEEHNTVVHTGPVTPYSKDSDRQLRHAAKINGHVYYKKWNNEEKKYERITGRPRQNAHHTMWYSLLCAKRRELIPANYYKIKKRKGKTVHKYVKFTPEMQQELWQMMQKTPLWQEQSYTDEQGNQHPIPADQIAALRSAKNLFTTNFDPEMKAKNDAHKKQIRESHKAFIDKHYHITGKIIPHMKHLYSDHVKEEHKALACQACEKPFSTSSSSSKMQAPKDMNEFMHNLRQHHNTAKVNTDKEMVDTEGVKVEATAGQSTF